MNDLIIVGGGASGCFAGAVYAKKNPEHTVMILESGSTPLRKVKISGGGRCNVTHACFIPSDLVEYYPRGKKALRGPFSRFMTGEAMEWFQSRGVKLKIETDSRVFPESDQSQTIIDCLLGELEKYDVPLHTGKKVTRIRQCAGGWKLFCHEEEFEARNVLFATGDNKKVWEKLERLGIEVVPPVPSLFTFNIQDPVLKGLQGLSVDQVELTIRETKLRSSGPLLITHWGLSGPAVLRLSSIGARVLHEVDYEFDLEVNLVGGLGSREVIAMLEDAKHTNPAKTLKKWRLEGVPSRLLLRIIEQAGLNGETRFGDLGFHKLENLAHKMCTLSLHVSGKSVFKEEFVTAGGVDLDEVDFRTMEAKRYPGIYFAGELLDIDALTGGFNFQAAWTTAWLAANNII